MAAEHRRTPIAIFNRYVMPTIYFDQRWSDRSGIGRFARELRSRIPEMVDLPIAGSPTSPVDALRLAWTLKRYRADGYFSPGFNVPFNSKCPSICTVHDLIHVHFPAETSLGKLAYYKYVQRPAVRRSPVVLTVSQYSRGQICEWYDIPEERVVCVGNGVSATFSPDGPRHETVTPFVLYVGNTRPHKNVKTLLRAFANLPNRDDLRLTLVSKPTQELTEFIRRMGIESRVEFFSGLDDSALATLYRSAVVTVLPSFFEGFGLPLVEAMASGCPVIGANRTSIPEIIGDAGLLFDPADTDALTDCLLRLLDNDTLRADLKKKGIRRSSDFSWDQVGSRTRDAIHSVFT